MVTGQLLTDHLAAGGEGTHRCLAKLASSQLCPWLLVVPTADPEALWAWPWGWGLLDQAHSQGITSPGRGRRGSGGAATQPGDHVCPGGRDAAEWPLGLILLVVRQSLHRLRSGPHTTGIQKYL